MEAYRVAEIMENARRKSRRGTTRVPIGIGDKRRHHAPDAGLHGRDEGRDVGLLQLRCRRLYDRDAFVRIGRRAPMPWKVFGARHDVVLLTSLDPRGGMRADLLRIRAERA